MPIISIIKIPELTPVEEWQGLMFRWNSKHGPCACGQKMYGPMVITTTWIKITKRHDQILCQRCMEIRLGRAIMPRDLRPCKWNIYRHAYVQSLLIARRM